MDTLNDLAEYFDLIGYDCTKPSCAYSTSVHDDFIVIDDLGGDLKVSDDAAAVVADVIRRFGSLPSSFVIGWIGGMR